MPSLSLFQSYTLLTKKEFPYFSVLDITGLKHLELFHTEFLIMFLVTKSSYW